MTLTEKAVFSRREFPIDSTVLEDLVEKSLRTGFRGTTLYCGYARLTDRLTGKGLLAEVEARVDGFFRLQQRYGFEEREAVSTVGIRGSRFALLIFWEVFHVLAPGGLWLDIDDVGLCRGTPLTEKDLPDRDYYREALTCLTEERRGDYLLRVYRKESPALIGGDVKDDGWTFGILTAGPSAAAAKLVEDILELGSVNTEVIICGPDPGGSPDDDRVRRIDLDRPEPRGWITRKKNLIADAATYGNLCIVHDRFVIPRNFFDAMRRYGSVFSTLTFPQFYFPEVTKTVPQRYPDYQALLQDSNLEETFSHKTYHADRIFHPQYDDFLETAFCCGGLYVTKRSLWQFCRQDESLYHCEWEDVHFGLDSQRKGIPHRVNPFTFFESVNGHPLLCTRMHTLNANGTTSRSLFHVSDVQKRLARRYSPLFKPVVNRSRNEYYSGIIAAFNALEMVDESLQMSMKDVSHCRGLFDFWKEIYRRVASLPLVRREDLLALYNLLTSFVYAHQNCLVQSWIRNTELSLARLNPGTVKGMSLLTTLVRTARSLLGTVPTRDRLVNAAISVGRELLPLYLRIPVPSSGADLSPFVSLLLYYWEVERYYPVIFPADSPSSASSSPPGPAERARMRERFLGSASAKNLVFVQSDNERLPTVWSDEND
jgi:hypothetical protein